MKMTTSTPSQKILTLYRGPSAPNTHVWSPFGNKLEARLRFAALPYRTGGGTPFSGPRGKIPYITLTDPSTPTPPPPTTIGDTALIITHLISTGDLPDLNAHLPSATKAHDLALRALLEEKLYWYQGYERWCENYYTMRDYAMQSLPYPVKVVVGLLAWRENVRRLYGQGTGRFSAGEIEGLRREVWVGVEGLCGDARGKGLKGEGGVFWVLGGEEPTEADATVYGFLVAVMVCDA